MNRNILLISLQEDLDVIGLKSLHYQLLDRGFASHILFLPTSPNAAMCDAICSLIAKLSPMFIGVSLMSVEYDRAVRLTHVLKSRYPSIPILWGGIHPTIAPETCWDHADYVCIGEGELFIVDFANALANGASPESLGSLSFQRAGQVVRNSLYPLIADLSAIPTSEHIPRDSYVLRKGTVVPLDRRTFRTYARYSGTTYSIMSSRGCPFSCTYCCNNALAKVYGSKKVRFREISSVIDELKTAVAQNPFIEYINFQDDCFLARSDEELEQFCRSHRQDVARPFIARSIPTFITEHKITSLKSAGLAWISLGLQSGSDHVCHEIYMRRSGKQDFLKAARIIKSHDLAAFYDIILDNPFETDEDRIETVLTLMETPKPFYTQFLSLTFYPGTEIRTRAIEEGLVAGDEYQSKDFFRYSKTNINSLVRLSSFLPSGWMKVLLRLYRARPNSLSFKVSLSVARLFAIAFAEPITYLKVIRLSQRKKLGATIRVLPHYVKEGLSRFRKQFG
jgi:anaerobic magnesium-protoporphyrin IX monomethyl ester cyclase